MNELLPPAVTSPLSISAAFSGTSRPAIASGDADALMNLRSVCDGAARMLATRGHNLVKANEYARAIECEAALGEMLAQNLR